MGDTELFDVIIIGGGIGGVISLKYARDADLNVCLLESKDGVGGIWRDLPSWQDIQFRREDWTMGEIPIAGEDQASILANIEAWVNRFQLASYIRFNTRVTSARQKDGHWSVTTDSRTYRTKNLIAATGSHNRAFIPEIERSGASIDEYHSSKLQDPNRLTGKTVVIVGGGASAFDLLDLSLEHRAAKVIWVYRTLKWMIPTRGPKYLVMDMRFLAKRQMLGIPIARLNRGFNQTLRHRYQRAGLTEILPEHEFDYRRHQIVPGRYRMIKDFAKIERHCGEIKSIMGNNIILSDGTKLDADIILWGTGYTIDLGYFGIESLAGITRHDDLKSRCNDLFASRDARNLYFLAPAVLETNTTTPWAYAHAARSVISEIAGNGCKFGSTAIPGNVNYFDMVKFLATRDRRHFPPLFWYLKYLALAFIYPRDKPMPVPSYSRAK